MQTRTRLRTLVPGFPSTLLWMAVSLFTTTAMANEPLQIGLAAGAATVDLADPGHDQAPSAG